MNGAVSQYIDSAQTDSAIMAVRSQQNLGGFYATVPLAFYADTALADSALQSIYAIAQADGGTTGTDTSLSHELMAYYNYYKLMRQIESDSGGVYSMTPSQLAQITALATDTTVSVGYNAQSILSLLNHKEFPRPARWTPIDTGTHRPIRNKQTITTIANAAFNLYPNPNQGSYSLDYSIKSTDHATMLVYNEMGMLTAAYNLDPHYATLKVNATSLSEGVYFYRIILNDSEVAANKFVIMK